MKIYRKMMPLPAVFLTDPYGVHIKALEIVDKSRAESMIAFAGMPDPMDPKKAGDDYFFAKNAMLTIYAGEPIDRDFKLYEVPKRGHFVMFLNPVKTQTGTKRRIPLWESGELSEFVTKAVEYYFRGAEDLEKRRIFEIVLKKPGVPHTPIHTVIVYGRYCGLAENFEEKILKGFGKCRSFGYGTPVLYGGNEE